MAAPFDLPDTVTIWSPAEVDVLFPNIPARVVPRWKEQDLLVTSGLDTIKYGYQYWVDTELLGPVDDGAGEWYSLAMQHAFSGGCLITFTSSLANYRLRIIWGEERWTNTEKAHQRFYCRREFVEFL